MKIIEHETWSFCGVCRNCSSARLLNLAETGRHWRHWRTCLLLFIRKMSARVMYDPRSQMTQFRETMNAKYGLKMTNYDDLYQWSITEYPTFWDEIVSFTGIIYSEPATSIVDTSVPMDQVPEWFPGL